MQILTRYSTLRLGMVLAAMLAAASGFAQEAPSNIDVKQVVVSMKILEFSATKGLETGFSAYYTKVDRTDAGGNVLPNGNAFESVDLTFPASVNAGITVFLDQISTKEGEFEFVLQALVDEAKASILSQPRAMVPVGSAVPTVVQTTSQVPFENTQVVGSTTVQTTEFKDTGVTFTVNAPQVYDLDADIRTKDDTFIKLKLEATLAEEGQRIVIALDDQLASGGDFSLANNAIQVPEFLTRTIRTNVWLRDGQVLILGGLYRNLESRTLSTIPWLQSAENFASSAVENAVSVAVGNPLSATVGNRRESDSRRELVFLIKAETWRPAFALEDDFGFGDPVEETSAPLDVIGNVSEGITKLFNQDDDAKVPLAEDRR